MRKLASIQKISSIEPIENADKIELIHVLGWQCIAKKGEFKEGDIAVYFEVDSFLPIKAQYEFLRKSSYKNNEYMGEGFKLKTITMRKQLSQGLALPIKALPELEGQTLQIGQDVTEILGIKEWKLPERNSSAGTIIGDRPSFIPKTDETRIQSMPELLKAFSGLDYYITTKCDGTSCSFGVDNDGNARYTGHTCEYKDDGKSPFVELLKSNGLAEKAKKFVTDNNLKNIVIQGEMCGEGIQKNRLKLKEAHWFVFTVKENNERVGLKETIRVCSELGLEMVPVEEIGYDLPAVYENAEKLLERADGNYACGSKKEGIVIRPVEPVFSPLISGPLSMKVINNKYLLNNED